MRLGALVPTLACGAALVVPAVVLAEPGHHRSRDHQRSGYERSSRSHGGYERGRSHRSYSRGYSNRHSRGHHRSYGHHPTYRYRRHSYRPHYRPYYRPYVRPYYGYRPYPSSYSAPYPVPYGYQVAPPPFRRGVHGGISIGVPGFGLSLLF